MSDRKQERISAVRAIRKPQGSLQNVLAQAGSDLQFGLSAALRDRHVDASASPAGDFTEQILIPAQFLGRALSLMKFESSHLPGEKFARSVQPLLTARTLGDRFTSERGGRKC